MTHRAPAHRLAGFTLIEVLIATIVLGLGVLGLSALFAGAAKQQQTAAEVSRAVAMSQGGVAIFERQLGRLVSLSGGGGTSLPPGTWDALAADDSQGQLTSRLALSNNRDMYFEVDATGAVPFIQSPQGGSITAVNNIRDLDLPHGRVLPDSLAVSVLIGPPGPVVGGGGGINFTLNTDPTLANDPVLRDYLDPDVLGPMPEYVFLYPGGVDPSGDYPAASAGATHSNPNVQWVLFRTGFRGGNAQIVRLNVEVGTGANAYVGRIGVSAYKWLNDILVSMNDRVMYRDSDDVPGGRLPIMSYAALYRESPDGASAEATIYSYAMRPLTNLRNRPDEWPYLSPETIQDTLTGRGVLREVPVTLGFDANAGQYYIVEPNENDEKWVAEPGQILMMSSRTGVLNAPDAGPPEAPNRLGADAPVRVLTRRTVRSGTTPEVRAILSDSPRFLNGASVLDDRTSTVQIHVWGVQPIVRSRSSDGAEWSLRPIDARTIKLIQN